MLQQFPNSAVNSNDSAKIYTTSGSPILLSDTCNVTIDPADNTIIHGSCGNTYGNVNITVSSATPFSDISLVNIGGNTGWTQGNPCKFLVTPCPPNNPNPCLQYNIFTNPKQDMRICYATGQITSTYSVLQDHGGSNIPVTINGVLATSSNILIIPTTPLPPGYSFTPDGYIEYDQNFPLIDTIVFLYKLCSIDGSTCVGDLTCTFSTTGCNSYKTSNHSIDNLVKENSKVTDLYFAPNPSSSGKFTLTLNSDSNDKMTLKIWNELVQNIFSDELLNISSYELDLSKFSTGTYFAILKNKNEFISKKLIIK